MQNLVYGSTAVQATKSLLSISESVTKDLRHINQGGSDVEKLLTEVLIVTALVGSLLFIVLVVLVGEGVL
jgi:hypothetical protein